MGQCKGIVFCVLAAFMGIMLLQGAFLPTAAAAEETTVDWWLKLIVDFPLLGVQDTINLRGPADLEWAPPYPSIDFPPHEEVDGEIDTVRLNNPTGVWGRERPGFPTIAKAYLLEPEPWVESFFDIYLEVGIPERAPGDTLMNLEPIRIYGMAHDWPPYNDGFKTLPGWPPIPLFGTDHTVVAFVISMEAEMIVHYEPEVHLNVETAYMSNVAVVGEDGLIRMSAGLSGDYFVEEAVFSYRLCGDPGPFTVFYVDMDSSAPVYSTVAAEGSGDGSGGYFAPGSDPFEGGQCCQFEASLLVPPYGYIRDTVEVWVDPEPPIPVFHDIERDSVAHYWVESFFDITYRLDEDMPGPGPSVVMVYPMQLDFERSLTPIDQLGLGTPADTVSCGPTAGASCLKYFAGNGYPGLDNPGGDVSKPEMSGEDVARELQGAMGTNATEGTTPDGMVAGIDSYLKKHGQSGWSVEHQPVDDATDLAEMFREFQSDSEDVLVLLEDTTAAGDTIGHVVTLGSTHTDYSETGVPPVGTPEMGIDFMDPWEGGSQEDNDYPLNTEEGGQPTTEGYDLDGTGGDAKVVGYVKVSPPEGAAGLSRRATLDATDRAPWITVASGTVTGGGVVDTLHWNTTGFAGGLYLMEIVTTNHQGFQCRDIRLAGIPTHTTDTDIPGVGMKTMLRGSYPNPFNPTTTIEYSLAKQAKVTLAIYDVAGRRVRTLISGTLTPVGVHTVSWDGKNDSGKQLASGVYFAHFVAEGQVEARKLILLR